MSSLPVLYPQTMLLPYQKYENRLPAIDLPEVLPVDLHYLM